MEKVIILNGLARSGKDSFVSFYSKYSKELIHNISTVDDVKEIAKAMGWNGEKDDKSRNLLSDLKYLWTEYNDGIFKKMINFCLSHEGIVFIHCREPKEIQKFKDYFGEDCTTLLIKRENIEAPNNHADMNVYKYRYDKVVLNNGTIEEYRDKVKEIVESNWL